MKEAIKLVANNKKAYHDYFIDEKFECGIELFGTEVKSIRMGKCSVKEAFVRIDKNEVYIYGMHINPYEKGNIFNKDPLRARKLVMHRSEINMLEGKIREKGLTLVPLQVYFKGSLVKVEIGLARGKKLYDKRDDIAKKDQRREVERDYKQKLRYVTKKPVFLLYLKQKDVRVNAGFSSLENTRTFAYTRCDRFQKGNVRISRKGV